MRKQIKITIKNDYSAAASLTALASLTGPPSARWSSQSLSQDNADIVHIYVLLAFHVFFL